MSTPPNRVRPGDLITAEFMNDVLDRLKTVEDQLAELGSTTGNSVVITAISPGGTLTVGQEIEVRGRGFGDPVSGNIVSMGGSVIERFLSGSDATRLRFTVPNIPGVPRSDVVVTVRYQTSSDSRTVSVNPAVVIPTGRLLITDVTGSVSPPGTILVGNTYTFWFDLDSQTIPGGENYLLSASYASAVGGTTGAWSAATSLLSSTEAPLTSNPMRLNPGNPARVGVRFTVPSGATSVAMTFVAQSINNDAGLSTSLGPIPIVIGETQEVSDPRVTFAIPPIEDGVPARLVTESGRQILEVRYRTSVRITLVAEMTSSAPESGTYQFSVALEPDNGPWVLTSPSPPPATNIPVDSGNDQTIEVTARVNADAAAGGAHPEERTLLVTVQRVGGDNFRSFRRIPIRGF
jgi:hypothetical protein